MKREQTNEARRKFLRKTAAYTGAGLLASALPTQAHAYVGGAGEISVALVGCGGRGTGAAAQAIQADPAVRLVAMADVFDDQLQNSFKGLSIKLADSGQIKVSPETMFVGFDAYKKAIDMADVVILTTPPGFRPVHFEYAVNQGKHVFMEKPLATDVVGIKKNISCRKISQTKKIKCGCRSSATLSKKLFDGT